MRWIVEQSGRFQSCLIRGSLSADVLLLAILLSIAVLSGCTSEPVTITKKPLTIKKIFLEDVSDKRKIPLNPSEDAATIWTFGCKTDLNFDIVENTELGKNDFLVTIRITKVHLTLTAPIEVWISKKASRSTMTHEMAHVSICKRFYQAVDSEAVLAARSVIGKDYQASGKSVEDAVRLSIERASRDIHERYNSAATDVIGHVSTCFDELEGRDHENARKSGSPKVIEYTDDQIESHLQEAFGKYQTQLGTKQK